VQSGVEFAYFYNCNGNKSYHSRYYPRIVPVEDEDVSKELEKQYKKQGIDIMTNASVESVGYFRCWCESKSEKLKLEKYFNGS
jgi:pyruvate/2-oxoglutarate dehydrogenase complex dihydrolipoamide dehydrogenase (E3) component